MKPALSLHHLTMIEAHPLDLIDAAAAGGFEYCGLRLMPPTAADAVVDVVGDASLQRAIRARLDDTGVRVLDIEAFWLQPQTDVRAWVPALEVGCALGATHVLCVGNDPDAQRQAERFAQMCDCAAALGLKVTLEFITFCSLSSLQQAHDLVQSCGRPNAQLLIDALHFFRSGAQPQDLTQLPPQCLPHAQICDGRALAPVGVDARRHEARRDRLLPGDGAFDLRAWVQALPAGIPMSIEAPTLELVGRPWAEQARTIAQRTRAFLDSCQVPTGPRASETDT